MQLDVQEHPWMVDGAFSRDLPWLDNKLWAKYYWMVSSDFYILDPQNPQIFIWHHKICTEARLMGRRNASPVGGVSPLDQPR